ncbi:hypothetical protein SCHPADRAFT_927291 [Schizopora paradoxa]|uniref:Uncharacterized protein n=1 Tax=Schizopora paradoxa TaxID=27342 RepID=A0A0H2RTR6_9AGAM|nr:hypothetical protein SCHPADRAFT_927291 [Schizopora paradoxa]
MQQQAYDHFLVTKAILSRLQLCTSNSSRRENDLIVVVSAESAWYEASSPHARGRRSVPRQHSADRQIFPEVLTNAHWDLLPFFLPFYATTIDPYTVIQSSPGLWYRVLPRPRLFSTPAQALEPFRGPQTHDPGASLYEINRRLMVSGSKILGTQHAKHRNGTILDVIQCYRRIVRKRHVDFKQKISVGVMDHMQGLACERDRKLDRSESNCVRKLGVSWEDWVVARSDGHHGTSVSWIRREFRPLLLRDDGDCDRILKRGPILFDKPGVVLVLPREKKNQLLNELDA